MAISNHERVGKALALLSDGLGPFVGRECSARYGEDWVEKVGGDNLASEQDAYFLLKTIWDEWHPVFRNVLGQTDRTYVSELRDVRNRWAHQESFSTDDAHRALDTAQRLLQAVAAGDEAAEVERLKRDLLRTKFEEDARTAKRRATAAPLEGMDVSGLKPWREIITPHTDVASGRYVQAEFAADLAQVYRGEGADEYRDPEQFFARTYVTEGLKQLLVQGLQRLSGAGGVPIVDLQTNFGGGKTHSLLALYHLCSGVELTRLAGVDAALEEAGVTELPEVQRAVLVGTSISPGQVHSKPDGTQVRTLWGELAWQLGGARGYEMVADADASTTNPGAALNDLFTEFGPCLVLIDEWVAYARQLWGKEDLPAGTFDAHFTFAQALTEAARAVPGTLVVISIPASEALESGAASGEIEIGGEGGRAALERLRNVIGRMESPWRPASAEESFEIVRRRLFSDLADSKAHTERDAIASEFANLYRTEQEEFPSQCREKDYERRIRAAYPIHPELFDRLYEDWSSLERFQRTRGVLRLMAAVINVLWERGDPGPLITPASVPLDDIRVTRELTRYLDDNWNPVIDQDVDGQSSLPYEIDAENPNLGRYSACRRVARSIFIGSAPKLRMTHRGIEEKRIKLGCVLPGEKPPIFGDALRRLRDAATFLYVDRDRYWYSTQASVTKLAQDRGEQLSGDDVDQEIVRRLQTQARTRGDFCALHPAPGSAEDVPDEEQCRLVLLGPGQDHSSKTKESVAVETAKAILEQRKGGPRRYRNMLVFVAPDRSRLEELKQAVRQYLAWKSIEEEAEELNLDPFQSRQATDRRSGADDAVAQRLHETYSWLIAPYQEPGGAEVSWEAKRISGQEPIAHRAAKKLKTDEGLITQMAALRLRMELDRVPLWRDGHVGVRQLWEDFAQYLYLPRLRDADVLLEAVADGPAQTSWVQDGFAYAQAYDEDSGRYRSLVAGSRPTVILDDSAVLVRPDVAQEQDEVSGTQEQGAGQSPGGADLQEEEAEGAEAGAEETRPTRFYGRVRLDPLKLSSQVGQISEAIVQHLASQMGAEVEVVIEVQAELPEGASEHIERTVTENARTLKFDAHGFEDS